MNFLPHSAFIKERKYAFYELKPFNGKKLVCVSKEGLELKRTEQRKLPESDLCSTISEKIITNHNCDSPCVLISDQFGSSNPVCSFISYPYWFPSPGSTRGVITIDVAEILVLFCITVRLILFF